MPQEYLYLVTLNPGLVIQGNPPNATEGDAYSYTLTADGGTAPYSWALLSGPGWLSIDASTGELTGTVGAPADYTFEVEVTDSLGHSVSTEFTITSHAAVADHAGNIFLKLAAWWELDEASGNFVDLHRGLDLDTYTNAVRGQTTVRSGGGASTKFSDVGEAFAARAGTGLGNYVAHIQGAMDHAVFAWYHNTDTLEQNSPLATSNANGAGSPQNAQYQLQIDTDMTLAAVWLYGASNTEKVNSASALNTATDHFAGYTKNTASKVVRFYIDGSLDSQSGYTNEPDGGSSRGCSVGGHGAYGGFSGYNIKGRLQQVILVHDELSADEVSWLYNAGAGRDYTDLSSKPDWTPAQLGNELLMWQAISPGVCAANSDGSGSVSVGSTVRYVEDLSGNGHHWRKASGGAPTLQQDAGGHYYLDFVRASNQYMVADAFSAEQAQPNTVFVAAKTDDHTLEQSFVDGGSASSRNAVVVGGDTRWRLYAGSGYTTSGVMAADTNTHVHVGLFNSTSTQQVDRAAEDSFGCGTWGITQVTVGCRYDGSSTRALDGRIYGVVFVHGTLKAGKFAKVQDYLAKLSGVTL